MKSKETIQALGLMSGTSLDGLDMAYVAFHFEDHQISNYEILVAETLIYPKDLEKQLRYAHLLPAVDLLKLDASYGKWLGEKIKAFKNKHHIENIDVVGSHGHTIFHQPENGFTFQIGHGAHLCAVSGENIVCDFRYQDIAWGGQGAPLVPIGDQILFSEYDACLNLGGFANISFKNDNNERIAFDICPVNYVLNALTKKLGLPYDDKGKIAKQHQINQGLLKQLKELPFYEISGPKSLGREWVEHQIFPLLKNDQLKIEDFIATFTHHVAVQISKILNKYHLKHVLATGGGVYNQFLIEEIENLTPASLFLPKPELIEYKEALIFALLAVLRLKNENNILASVTGTKKSFSAGKIYHDIFLKL